ncbi:MAG: DUF2784 domain-containing protein [Pseudomonadales bacterium]
MSYRIAAELVLVVHVAFVVVVLLGGFLWLWWRWAPLLHLPMAGWGAFVELSGRICPLTVWENALLRSAGAAGYEEGFIAHYLLAALYPDGLTRTVQGVLAALVIVANLLIYLWVWRRRREARR